MYQRGRAIEQMSTFGPMSWFRRLMRGGRRTTGPADEWRRLWADAAASGEPGHARDLRARLAGMDAGAGGADELEIEHEMLDGLDALVELTRQVRAGDLPTVATGHRVVGTDRCHFAAPASLADDHAQAGGTLLLTSTRAIFAGGGRAQTVPWHAVRSLAREERDLLITSTAGPPHRIRCNTYGDALRAAFLAHHLTRQAASRTVAAPARQDVRP